MVRGAAGSDGGFREEVINVKLAEILVKHGVLSVPERILATAQGSTRLPDVIIGHFSGLRLIIEGRVGDQQSVRSSLETDCRRRIKEAIVLIAVGVIYPVEIRASPNLAALEQNLASTTDLLIKVFTENSEGDWSKADVGSLAQSLRRAYENLVGENIVDHAVDTLRVAIEVSVQRMLSSPATETRLREVLIVPKSD